MTKLFTLIVSILYSSDKKAEENFFSISISTLNSTVRFGTSVDGAEKLRSMRFAPDRKLIKSSKQGNPAAEPTLGN